MMSQVLDMKTYISSYREARETETSSSQETCPTSRKEPSLKQNHSRIVLLQVLQIQHSTLAKFRHCGYFTHVIRQPFRAISTSLDMFCMLDIVLRQYLYRLRS